MKVLPSLDLKSRQQSKLKFPIDAFTSIATQFGKKPSLATLLRRVQVVADEARPFYDPFGANYDDNAKLLTTD